ncbi:hypothetical protein [Curtobacterium phage Reje]|nr:hypothetical protein QEJ62_gp18 [Curtobacterium phage Reje]QXG07826.1 hypothetical protein [Curtobacterium phage Reje]
MEVMDSHIYLSAESERDSERHYSYRKVS